MNEVEEPALPCADKMVFETKKEAEAIALTLDWQRGRLLKVYKCQHCGLWHLTTA